MTENHRVMPTSLAFLISDTIIEDSATGKKSIIGLFNYICSSRFPFKHHELNLFISLTDGHGTYRSRLVCSRAIDESEILSTQSEVTFHTPNSVVEICFTLRKVEFPSPGKYTFQFFIEDQLLIMRPFEVVPPEMEEE